MFSEKRFDLLVGLILMFILGMVMAAVASLVSTGTIIFVSFLKDFICAFTINVIASFIIPAGKLGEKFALKLGATPPSFKFLALSSLIPDLIYVTIVSFLMTVIKVGFAPILFMAWMSVYPIVLILGYFVVLIVTPLAVKLAKYLTAPEEENNNL